MDVRFAIIASTLAFQSVSRMHFDNPEDIENRYVKPTEMQRKLGVSRTTVWRMEKDGTLPQRDKRNGHSLGWQIKDLIGSGFGELFD